MNNMLDLFFSNLTIFFLCFLFVGKFLLKQSFKITTFRLTLHFMYFEVHLFT